MADSSAPTELVEEFGSTSLQQMVINEEQLPDTYFYKDSINEGFSVPSPSPSLSSMDIPIIDFELLKSPSDTTQLLQQLRSGLTSHGCIQAINHGMTSEFLDKVRDITKQFFALPESEKRKYQRQVGSIEGYGNDMVLLKNQQLDWNDRLYLTLRPRGQQQHKFWPQNPQSFWEILDEYTLKLEAINEVLLKAMARSLDLKENRFLEQFGQGIAMDARINLFPPCSKADVVLGLKPHSDGSAITIVLQDKQVEGLQFLNDNKQWLRAPSIPEALLINIGDQVEIMSNGIFKSPIHRATINPTKERVSLVMFCSPTQGKEIEPMDELVGEKRPKLYKKVKDYAENYFQDYQLGKRPIEAAKL